MPLAVLGSFLEKPSRIERPQFTASGLFPIASRCFHLQLSRGIIDTLNGLLKEFEERLATLEKEEEAAQASFDEAAKSKREEIDTAKSTLETREEQLADNESALRAIESSYTGCGA